jgi:hypothetical protein
MCPHTTIFTGTTLRQHYREMLLSHLGRHLQGGAQFASFTLPVHKYKC